MFALIQLTETDKRVIFAIFLLLILLFVLVGYIGLLITRVMKKQGQRLDTKVYDVVVTRVIDNKKDFKKYAKQKNIKLFYKEAQIPVLIMLISGLCLLIFGLINNFKYSIFDPEHGFLSLFFIWDFSKIEYNSFLGIKVWANWPPLHEVYGNPAFVPEGIPAYIGCFGLATGIVWYFIAIQAFIARRLRINKLCDSIFEKTLDGFNLNQQRMSEMGIVIPQQPAQQPQPQAQPQPQQNESIVKKFFK